MRTWPWTDDQVALWVQQHKIAADKELKGVSSRVAEVIRPGKRVRRAIEPTFPVAALVSETKPVVGEHPVGEHPVVERKRRRLRPVGADAALETPSSCSTDVAPCSLFAKWSEAP